MTPEDQDPDGWIEATVAGMAPTPDMVALKEGLRARMAEGPRSTVVVASPAPRRVIWPWVAGLAAAAIMVFLVNKWMPSGQPIREFASAAGSRSTIVLRDGTRVILGPESKIQIPSDFGTRDRTVQLNGEAYFAVVHDGQHPFAVFAHNVNITDIGTEFDVRAYDARVRVAVTKGEISLRSHPPLPLTPSPVAFGAGRGKFINGVREGGSEKRAPSAPVSATRPYDGNGAVYLGAGDLAEATEAGLAVTHNADIASATAWTQGQLVFKNTPLGEAVRDLARTFDLQITLADTTLAHELVTGAFGSESADFILDNVTAVVGARYERQGKKVVIERRSGAAMNDKRPVPLNTAQARGA